MEAEQFDRLSRSFREPGTRRGLMRHLVVLPVFGVLLSTELEESPAAKRARRRKQRRRKARRSCPGSKERCSGACVDTDADPRNCGECGRRCQVNQVCDNGECICVNRERDCVGKFASWQCCNAESTFSCSCSLVDYTDPLNCNVDIPEADCPPAQRCVGTLDGCRTCCPPGSTCEPTTGTCLQ